MPIILTPSFTGSSMSLLQMIQTACKRIGISSPNQAITSTDPQILQLVSICEEEGQEMAERYPWQELQQEATFSTVASQVQANLSSITIGFEYIVNDTIWNRTLRRPVYGPKSQQDWQQAKAMQINGPFNSYRIIGNVINFYPNPAAGQTCAFEYITDNWISTSAGGQSSTFTNDADITKLDDQVIVLGLIWRWKQVKGLDYAEDFAKYERRITDLMARNGGKPTLNMNGGNVHDIQPVVMVPRGSWGI